MLWRTVLALLLRTRPHLKLWFSALLRTLIFQTQQLTLTLLPSPLSFMEPVTALTLVVLGDYSKTMSCDQASSSERMWKKFYITKHRPELPRECKEPTWASSPAKPPKRAANPNDALSPKDQLRSGQRVDYKGVMSHSRLSCPGLILISFFFFSP